MSSFDFQKKFTFEKREQQAMQILRKYPHRIPIICEISKIDRSTIHLDKNKYLAPADISLGQFLYIIRKRIKLQPDDAIFIFTETDNMPICSINVKDLQRKYVNKDGFLYLMISRQSTFG